MKIQRATEQDWEEILSIYKYAREQMKLTGNPTQWGDNRPSEEAIRTDLEAGTLYVVCEDEIICGVFSFSIAEDPTYAQIEAGQWLNDEPYGVIHKVAGNGKTKGVFYQVLAFCENKIENIRIDTHENNRIMRHLLEKNGYQYCGIIYVDDGTPRFAYHKCTGIG